MIVTGETKGGRIEVKILGRKGRRGIRVEAYNETYTLNQEDVFGYEFQFEGRTWYGYGGKLNSETTMTQRYDLARDVRKAIGVP